MYGRVVATYLNFFNDLLITHHVMYTKYYNLKTLYIFKTHVSSSTFKPKNSKSDLLNKNLLC